MSYFGFAKGSSSLTEVYQVHKPLGGVYILVLLFSLEAQVSSTIRTHNLRTIEPHREATAPPGLMQR